MLLCYVSINHTQFLDHVDQTLQEDSEALFREQEGYRNQGEYTYDGWRKIDIVLKCVIESYAKAIV